MKFDNFLFLFFGLLVGFLSFWFYEPIEAVFVFIIVFYLGIGLTNVILFSVFFFFQLKNGDFNFIGIFFSIILAILAIIFILFAWPVIYFGFNGKKTDTSLDKFELQVAEKYA